MTRIGNIRRVNFKNIKYGKYLDDLLPRAMENLQLEENVLTQTVVSKQAKINNDEETHYANITTMNSYSGAIGIDNRCTA